MYDDSSMHTDLCNCYLLSGVFLIKESLSAITLPTTKQTYVYSIVLSLWGLRSVVVVRCHHHDTTSTTTDASRWGGCGWYRIVIIPSSTHRWYFQLSMSALGSHRTPPLDQSIGIDTTHVSLLLRCLAHIVLLCYYHFNNILLLLTFSNGCLKLRTWLQLKNESMGNNADVVWHSYSFKPNNGYDVSASTIILLAVLGQSLQ